MGSNDSSRYPSDITQKLKQPWQEVLHELARLQSLAGMEIDVRAKASLLQLAPRDALKALRQVEPRPGLGRDAVSRDHSSGLHLAASRYG